MKLTRVLAMSEWVYSKMCTHDCEMCIVWVDYLRTSVQNVLVSHGVSDARASLAFGYSGVTVETCRIRYQMMWSIVTRNFSRAGYVNDDNNDNDNVNVGRKTTS